MRIKIKSRKISSSEYNLDKMPSCAKEIERERERELRNLLFMNRSGTCGFNFNVIT
jgi:hypothetical protein